MIDRFSKKYGYEIEVALQENGNIVRMFPQAVEINYTNGFVKIYNGATITIAPLSRLVHVRATKLSPAKTKRAEKAAQQSGEVNK